MEHFRGKVAVITGAASGIGRALADHAAHAGMRVVLANIDGAALQQAAHELESRGTEVLAVPTDVSDADAVAALAEQTLARFGAVHLLCNNAGVGMEGNLWEYRLADWHWVIGVNVWGVIHGIRTFVPIMLAQETESHIINTASGAGLITNGNLGIYTMTKHAVVAVSETLALQLRGVDARVKVSVLCPAFVRTNLAQAAKHRPARLRNETDSDTDVAFSSWHIEALERGVAPEEVAAAAFAAIEEERFYILTPPGFEGRVRRRMENILLGRSPWE